MTNYVNVFGGATIPPSDYKYSSVTLTMNTALFWPYNYTGSGMVVSRIMEVSADAGLSLNMPPASEVSTGEDVLFRNMGTNSFTVKDALGLTLATIAAGESKFLYVKDNTSVGGVWGVFTYGTGTSGADASALAGNGLSASGTLLQTNQPIVSFTSSHNVISSDRGNMLNFTGGTGTFTLPSASSLTAGFWCGVINSGTGSLTIATTSGTIDGVSTKVLAPSESCIVTTDGSNYITLGYGRSSAFVFTQLPVDLTGLSAYTVTSAQSANKLWYFYNTPASNVTVTIPAVASVYYIKVDSLGGFSLTFTTGSGTTYGVLQNQQAIIFCDGTNVVAAQTASLSASSVTIADGSVSAPSFNWSGEPSTGVYRSAAGHIDFTVLGSNRASITASGITANVVNVPAGNIAATTVQGAINELDTEKVALASKDASGGYAGLTLFTINFKNALNTVTSFFTNANTAARTYTFQDRDGTIADNTDLAGKAALAGSASQAFSSSNFTTAQGLTFPATQNPSADVHTLDDYEEGTWIPSLGGTATYTSREGYYVKIGKQVTATGYIAVAVLGTGEYNMISGLPFVSGNNVHQSSCVGYYDNIATPLVSIYAFVNGFSNVINLNGNTVAGSNSGAFPVIFRDYSRVDFTVTYFTA